MHHPLEQVRKGMKVFDAANHEIGKVEWVKFSDEDPGTPEAEVAGVNPIDEEKPHSLMEDLAEAFHPDDLPHEVRERLLLEGFIRMDAEGLFNADRYVLPDQIASVSGDGVKLKVKKEDLVKTP